METESEIVVSKELFSFLKLFYNWCFFTFLVPLRIEYDTKSKKFVYVAYKTQMICCGFLHVIFVSYFLHLLVLMYLPIIQGETYIDQSFVSSCMSLTSRTLLQIFYFQFIKSAWFSKQKILNMVNVVTFKDLAPSRVLQLYTTFTVFGPIAFALITITSVRIVYYWTPGNDTVGGIQNFYADAYFAPCVLEWLSWWPFRLAWFCLQVHRMTFCFINQSFLPILGCGLIGMALDFQRDLKRYGRDVEKGVQIYRELKVKINVVNQVVGERMLTVCIFLITYYASIPDVLMGNIHEWPTDCLLTYLVVITSGWIVVARFHTLVQKAFSAWIEQNLYDSLKTQTQIPDETIHNGLPSSKEDLKQSICVPEFACYFDRRLTLMIVKDDMNSEPVALATPFFFVTNSFLCSILGLVVTYGIIIFQTSSPRRKITS